LGEKGGGLSLSGKTRESGQGVPKITSLRKDSEGAKSSRGERKEKVKKSLREKKGQRGPFEHLRAEKVGSRGGVL